MSNITITRVQVDFNLSEDEIQSMIRYAIRFGWKRLEPTKSWSTSEKKEAVRFAIALIIVAEANKRII